MADRTDSITRDELIRAIQATRWSLLEGATGSEALDALAKEVTDPHTCTSIHGEGTEGECRKCHEWVEESAW